MSAKYKSPSFLLPNELNTSANTANDTGINSLYSMDFDGTQNIDCGNDSSLTPTNAISISFWIKTTDTDDFTGLIDKRNGSIGDGYGVDIKDTYLRFIIGSQALHSTTSISDGNWHNVVCICDNTNGYIYVDGSQVKTGSLTLSGISTLRNLYLMGDGISPPSTYKTTGQMDEVAIFNRALDTTEIAALYGGTSPNIYPSNLMASNLGPIAYYPLGEQAQNSGYPSATGNEWQFPNGVLQDYVMDFDSTSPGDYISAPMTMLNSATQCTISFWGKKDASNKQLNVGGWENDSAGVWINWYSNGVLYLTARGPGATSFSVPYTKSYDNNWHHFLGVYDGSSAANCKLYLDGDLVATGSGTAPSSLPATTGDNFQIGALGTSYLSDGQISNVAVWNTAITDANQIANIYNNGSPQTSYTVTPQNWWKLNADSVYTPSAPNYTTAVNFNYLDTEYLSLGTMSTLSTEAEVTFSIWAKITKPGGTQGFNWIYTDNSDGGSGNKGSIYIKPSGFNARYECTLRATGSLRTSYFPITTFNSWHNVTVTFGTTYAKLYLNGQLQDTEAVGTAANLGVNAFLGKYASTSTVYATGGLLSNFAIFNSELSASQISTLFNFGTPETNISFSPVHYWKLNDINTGLNDIGSLASNNATRGAAAPGTVSPGPTTGSTSVATVPSWKIPSELPITTTPNYTTALDFDGSDYIDCGNNSSLQFQAADPFSVSAWVNINSVTGNADFIVSNGLWNTSPYSGWGLNLQGANTLRFDLTDNTPNQLSIDSSGLTLNTNTWYHVLFTYDGSNSATGMNFYLDGLLTSKTIVANNALGAITYTSSMKLNIGARESGVRPFNGDISNVSIFDSALSASQVLTLYNNGTPETAISFSPVSWWKLDTGGSTITDYGSGGNNGTNNGPATQVTSDVLATQPVNGVSTTLPSTALQQSDLQFDSPYSNYSLSFDGNSYIDTNFTLPASYTSFSYSFWFRWTSSSNPTGNEYLIGNGAGQGNNNEFRGGVKFRSYGGVMNLSIFGGDDTNADYNVFPFVDATSILDQQWHHISITFVSGEIKTFFDGSLVNTYTNSLVVTGYAANRSYVLGQNGLGTGYLVNSMLDEFAIFNKKLTEAEILSIYNNGKPGDISPIAPTNWWRLGENAYFVNNDITLPNSIAGAPNGVSSGTATSMLSADAPGTYANGIGDGLAITDRVGDAPLSVANSQSYNMIPDDKVPYVPGYVGTQITNTFEMTFDGVGDYFDAGVISALSNVSQYSVSLWANIDTGASGILRLFGNRESSSPYNGIGADIDLSASLYFYLNGGPSYPVVQVANISNYVTAGTWFHLVCTFNAGQAYVYIDGVQRGSDTGGSTADTTTNPLYIGADSINTNSYFYGLIDEVAIFDKALTADQIKFDLYNATTTGKTADIENNTNLPTPVAWYRMGD
jgi:hypothetical protein